MHSSHGESTSTESGPPTLLPSPLAAQLLSYYLANSAEGDATMAATVDDPQRALEQIQALQAQLHRDAARISAYIHAHNVQTPIPPSAIHRFPLEVLEEVFDHGMGMGDQELYLPPMPAQKALSPLTVMQVCSRWRAAALSRRSLWQSFNIEIGRDYDHNKLRSIIDRGGNGSLSITLSIPGGHVVGKRPARARDYSEWWYSPFGHRTSQVEKGFLALQAVLEYSDRYQPLAWNST